MTKIGLKLWNLNTDFYKDCAQELYHQGVFDYIELYVVPGNIDKLQSWKKLDIPFDIHAPHYAHGLNLSKSDLFAHNRELYDETKIYADELNSSVIVFHGGSGGDYKETAKQLSSFNDKRILIENKPYVPLSFVQEPYYVGSKFEEIEYITRNAKVGFCLDIGHCICAANAFKIDPYSYIENMNSLKPKRIHLSDIHIGTTLDEHLNYGMGELNFDRLLNIINPNYITIETTKKSKTDLLDFENDAKFLKEKLSKILNEK